MPILHRGHISKIEKNQIYVFGSNTEGRHSKGAAKFAKDKCGAIYGQAMGRQGKSYAIVTKNLRVSLQPSIPLKVIKLQIEDLYEYASLNPELVFVVPYRAMSTNLNGYTPYDMAGCFASKKIPYNISFEDEFWKLITQHLVK